MARRSSAVVLCVALFAACVEDASNALAPDQSASFARGSESGDPTATWKLPLADDGLSLRSDRNPQFGDDTYSVYGHGVCGVSTRIFATTAGSNSGDATIQTSAKGNKCARYFRLVYPASTRYPYGGSDLVTSFNNLNKLQNTSSSIAVGSTAMRRLIINPSATYTASRCGRVIFGSNDVVGQGTDMLLVTRKDARTWEVRSQANPYDRALCEDTGEIYNMQVSFVVVASRDLLP